MRLITSFCVQYGALISCVVAKGEDEGKPDVGVLHGSLDMGPSHKLGSRGALQWFYRGQHYA